MSFYCFQMCRNPKQIYKASNNIICTLCLLWSYILGLCMCVPSLAQVPCAAGPGVGPVQPGNSVSWSVRWLPVWVPGARCCPEVQKGQTHCPQYVCVHLCLCTWLWDARETVFDSNCALFLLQSPQTTQWLMGVRRYCWMQGSPTTWAVCLEGQSRPPWSSGSKMVYLWRGLTASL